MATQFEPQAQRLAARDIVSAKRDGPGPQVRQPGRRDSGWTNAAAAGLVFVLGAGGMLAYEPLAKMAGSILNPRVVADDPHAMISATFSVCTAPRQQNCVLDGDTLRFSGTTVRIADIDAPEVFSPSCPDELKRGNRATDRLLQLVNSGPFEVAKASGQDRDVYGRSLRLIMRGGRSVGQMLVTEGLARTWDGARHAWC